LSGVAKGPPPIKIGFCHENGSFILGKNGIVCKILFLLNLQNKIIIKTLMPHEFTKKKLLVKQNIVWPWCKTQVGVAIQRFSGISRIFVSFLANFGRSL